MNTDKIAAVCHIMHLEGEIARLRGCWKRSSEARDSRAMSFFQRAAEGIKAEVAYAKRAAKHL